MRSFAEFVRYEQAEAVCCQVAKDAANDEPGIYNCATCPVAAQYATLQHDQVNSRAWQLYRQVNTRFTLDAQCVGQAWERLTREYSTAEYADMLQRMTILATAFHPDEEPKDPDGA